MKIILFLIFFTSLIVHNSFNKVSHKTRKSHKNPITHSSSSALGHKTAVPQSLINRIKKLKAMNRVLQPKPIPAIETIAFGNAATNQNEGLNSLGETGYTRADNIILSSYPFRVTRCDQVVHFPVTYINNEDDYRVRNKGYVTITVHLTNLFHDKDGQKLVQTTNHAQMRAEPCHLLGARGCIKLPKDKMLRLHNMDYCVENMVMAENILYVYKEFKRCRMGDSLEPIPVKLMNALTAMCHKNKDKSKLNIEF